MAKLRIGVIGLRFGQYHVQTLANHPDYQLVGVADRADAWVDKLKSYAQGYGARGYRDAMDMLEQEDLDAVSICTSPRYRPDLIEAIAESGIPMFIEKPWASNSKQAQHLAIICEQYKATVMTGFSFRFHHVVQTLHDLMGTILGEGWILNGEYLFGWIPDADNWLWHPDNGNGFFNENSCHLLDVVCYLMGKPISVFAEGVNYHNSPSAEAATLTIRFENGSVAALMIGGLGTSAHQDYPRINLVTENGQAQLQGLNHYWQSLIWASRDDAMMHRLESPPEALSNTRYSDAFTHFADCIRHNKTPTATVHDGIISVALAEAIYESITTGKRITIQEE